MLSFLLSLFALFSNLTFAMEPIVHKYALDNGFTVLIHPIKTTQNVSTQLWINVGSKHESDDEKGLAHWLEHMCFKGTEKMSETDIQLICSKLSGSRNAVTNYDRTHFYLNFPTQHWHEALPILSDMMSNCTFKQDLLNAELQVVIQEMKNNRDNFDRTIKLELMAAVFPDHPYHYPVLGYKSDLTSLSRDKLNAFYKKHYVPNNATLVIVGNVDPKEALELAKKHFAAKTPNFSRTTTIRTSQETITSKSLKIYRSIKNPLTNLAYKIPGMKVCCSDISVNLLCTLLTGGQNSRLYKKLVEDLKLVSTINMHTWNLHDYCMLWISFIPLQAKDNNRIIKVIQEEIDNIAKCGPTVEEMDRVLKSLGYNVKSRKHFFDELAPDGLRQVFGGDFERPTYPSDFGVQVDSIVCSAPRSEWCLPLKMFYNIRAFKDFNLPSDGVVERDTQAFGNVVAELSIDHFRQMGLFKAGKEFEHLADVTARYFRS